MFTMTQIQLSGVRWPGTPNSRCAPRCCGAAFFVPTLTKGGPMMVLPKFYPPRCLRTIDEQKITVAIPSMYALMDPSQLGHARPVDDRGRLTSSCVSSRRFKSHRLPWLRPIGPLLR